MADNLKAINEQPTEMVCLSEYNWQTKEEKLTHICSDIGYTRFLMYDIGGEAEGVLRVKRHRRYLLVLFINQSQCLLVVILKK